jgi:hypothetical protein
MTPIHLDTTGEYLQIGRHKSNTIKQDQNAEMQEAQKLFLDNAFLFLDNRERILSDSRMRLAPVPIQSGLAYTGTNGFRNPTLGVYLEFWMNCPQAAWIDEDGRKHLVYRIAGSPLTGRNSCGIVNEDGTTKNIQLPCFSNLWRTFMEINRKRNTEMQTNESYSLPMVVEILKGFHCTDHEAFFYKEMADYWSQRCKATEATIENLSRQLLHAKMSAMRQQLTVLLNDADRKQLEIDSMEEETRMVRREMLNKLHAMDITPAEYQRWWTALPIRKKKDEAIASRKRMIDDTLRSLFREEYCGISLTTIRQFLEEPPNNEIMMTKDETKKQ